MSRGKKSQQKPRVAITMGDPAGIGPEIICKLFAAGKVFRYGYFMVVGDAALLGRTARSLKLPLSIFRIPNPADAAMGKKGCLAVMDMPLVSIKRLRPGRVTALAGRAAFTYLKKGVELARDRQVDALVTAPISKAALHKAGYPYNGHTEILAGMCGTRNYAMLMAGQKIRVMLVTTHCAWQEVGRRLSRARVYRTIKLAGQALKQLGLPRARIGVMALNPHGGEGGLFGQEEKRYIIPAIRKARAADMDVVGPLVPDVAFRPENRAHFDIFVCMYHDQGLIPFKMLEFKTGVNVTIGLPIVRTSVDHGTAFDIAGQGRADCTSLEMACRLASRMASMKRPRKSNRGGRH